ncbi:MAG: tripartite tricarboxylate transporter substrate binding protein BugD [Rhizobiales bacterium]|nr:tripartite tricarboxylate transporter substrate binding protein BugD [Hyphomicrobiales bacterium]
MHRLTLAAALLLPMFGAAVAQDYPTRPITLIVPFPAGGPTDTIARVTAQSMSKPLGQQIIIENVSGAGGTLGAGRASRAAPDGYTLLLHHIGLATADALYRKLPYATKKAFAPIGLVTDAPMVFIGRSDLAPSTLGELVAYAKKQGEKLTFGTSGVGSSSQLCAMLFTTAIQTKLTQVPYKGGGPLMNDLIGGQVDIGCEQATTGTPPIRSKRVKGYAVTTMSRLQSLPDLPTANEAGLKGFALGVWHGLYAPAGTPTPVIQKLAGALQVALKDPDLIKRFESISTEPIAPELATPEALQKHLSAEVDRWAPIIKASGEHAD